MSAPLPEGRESRGERELRKNGVFLPLPYGGRD